MLKHIRYLILLGLLGAVAASAQTIYRVRVHVPFPFNAANRTWAPGTYQLNIDQNGVVILRSSRRIGTMVTQLTQASENEVGNYLQFVKYGDRWVLSQIVTDGLENDVPPGRLAREYMAHKRSGNHHIQIAFDQK